MIIDRRIFPVKFGKMDEVVQILAGGGDIVPDRPKARILTSSIGPHPSARLTAWFWNWNSRTWPSTKPGGMRGLKHPAKAR